MRRSIQTIKTGSSVKVTFDGNSLIAANVVSPTFAAFATGSTVAHCGISGQTWQDMTTAATDVDGNWVSGKTNVLFMWETTNAIFNTGRTSSQTISDALAYIAARKSSHPNWRLVMILTIPRQNNGVNEADRIAKNQTMDAVDAYFKNNYRASGIDALVDLRRPGSPFVLPDYTDASFVPDPYGFWQEAAGNRVHLTTAGYQWVAARCWETFIRLRVR